MVNTGIIDIDFYHGAQNNKPINTFLSQFTIHFINLIDYDNGK